MRNKHDLFFKFLYKECLQPYYKRIILILFVCSYWAFDLNFKPYLFKQMMDMANASKFKELSGFMSVFIFFLILKPLLMRVYDYLWFNIKIEMKNNMLRALMRHLISNSNIFLHNNFSIKFSNQIQEITNTMPLLVNLIVNDFFSHFMAFLFALILFFNLHVTFAMMLLTLIIIFLTISFSLAIKAQFYTARATTKQFALFAEVSDIFANLFSVKIVNSKKFEMQRLEKRLMKFYDATIRKSYFYLFISFFQSVFIVVYQIACFVFLVMELNRGNISVGDFVMIFAINKEVLDCLCMVSDDLLKAADYYGIVSDTLFHMLMIEDRTIKSLVDSKKDSNYSVELKNIDFKYPDQVDSFFKDFSLKIESGQKIGLVGHSGSGKSSLVNIILQLCNISSGKISIGEKDYTNCGVDAISDFISVISQDLSLFNRSVLENIRYGTKCALQDVYDAAKIAQIHDFIENLPNKYESVAGVKGSNFSMGQRQRILIARAVLSNKPILILDEATSSLDYITELAIMNSLKKVMKNKTVIAIAHKISTLKMMDKIIVLKNGKMMDFGTHKELATKDGIYKKLLELSFQ